MVYGPSDNTNDTAFAVTEFDVAVILAGRRRGGRAILSRTTAAVLCFPRGPSSAITVPLDRKNTVVARARSVGDQRGEKRTRVRYGQ